MGPSDGQFREMPVGELKPHPLNSDLYNTDDRGVEEIVERIQSVGFRDEHRILVTPESHFTDADWTIISGHRRVAACREVGLESVPAEVVEYDTPAEEQANLVLANLHRNKTRGEITREGHKLAMAERARAEERQLNPRQNYAEGETGRARDFAAEHLGISRESLRKGEYVLKKANNGNVVAQRQMDQLDADEQSYHGAYEAVKNAEGQERDGPPQSTRELDDGTGTDTTPDRDESRGVADTDDTTSTEPTPDNDATSEYDLPTCSTVARDDQGLIINAGGAEYRLPTDELP